MNSLEEAVSRLRQEGVKTGVTKCLDLDLCSLASVRRFTKEFTDLGLPLHVLVNNGRMTCSITLFYQYCYRSVILADFLQGDKRAS